MLNLQEFFAKALMVEKPWYVQEVQFDQQVGKLEIWIDFERLPTFYFEDRASGISGYFKAYDTIEKTWRHLNFFQYHCYLHAWIPRVDIGDGKISQINAPWEGQNPGFTLLFEALVPGVVKVMPIHEIRKEIKRYGKKLWNMFNSYTEIYQVELDFSAARVVGVDENAFEKIWIF
jgi:transposase